MKGINTSYKKQFQEILKAITVDEKSFKIYDHQYQIDGGEKNHSSQNGDLSIEEEALADQLTNLLASKIYEHFYIFGKVQENPLYHTAEAIHHSENDFLVSLEKSNQSKDIIDRFWEVYAISHNGTFARKNENVLSLSNVEYQLADPSQKISVGSYIHVITRGGSAQLQPGFYYVFGEQRIWDHLSLIRFYFNIEAEGAPILIYQLTTLFNKYQIPFSFKSLDNPKFYNRTDGSVLYIEKRYYTIAWEVLKLAIPQISTYLQTPVPLFVHPLSKGIGFAEDPGLSRSFGLTICHIIATDIVNNYQVNKRTSYQSLEARFNEMNLDIDHPYLNRRREMSYYFDQQ